MIRGSRRISVGLFATDWLSIDVSLTSPQLEASAWDGPLVILSWTNFHTGMQIDV